MITSYPELIAEVGEWLDRDDLAPRAGTFVQLAETRLNRLLDDPNMEVAFSGVASGDSTSLPADFGAMVSLSTGHGDLPAISAVELAALPAYSGNPRAYAIVNNAITFVPRNASTPYTMVYRRRIPALTDTAPSNWLLTLAPDVYLYGTLMQASAFLVEDDRIPLWKSAFDEAIGELITDGARRKWGAGPIAPRIQRT